jgi:hypothetical protein
VALRKLIVSALRECYADFAGLLHRSTPWVARLPAPAAAFFTARFAEGRHRSGQPAIKTIH